MSLSAGPRYRTGPLYSDIMGSTTRCTRAITLRRSIVLAVIAAALGYFDLRHTATIPSTGVNETTAELMAEQQSATDAVPPRVLSLLRESWADLDPSGPALVSSIRQMTPLNEFPHARDTFGGHLLGTFGLLALWGQPNDVCRAGLFHTAYSGDIFRFFLYDAANAADRAELRSIIGDAAEQLTWLFGTVDRGSLLGLSHMMEHDLPPSYSLADYGEELVPVAHRLHGRVSLSTREVAKIMIVTIADYLEQLVAVNGWLHHHQVESPSVLWPGDGKPGLGLAWASSLCHAIRSHLEVVPPIFERCTRTLTRTGEVASRDGYWRAVSLEAELPQREQAALYTEAIAQNPFIGEPELMLAQLYFRSGDFGAALTHCGHALRKFVALGTAWDKRRTYAAWVGYARLLDVRARRSLRGEPSMPEETSLPMTSGGMTLISIRKLVGMMP